MDIGADARDAALQPDLHDDRPGAFRPDLVHEVAEYEKEAKAE